MGTRANRPNRIALAIPGLTIAALAIARPAPAAQLSQTNAADSRSAIVFSGDINHGDASHLIHFIQDNFVTRKRSLTAIYLDSNGGFLDEGNRIAALVHRLDVAAVVADGAACVSACLVILAASTQRIIGARAKLAVHSVAADPDQIGGKTAEDNSAMASTVELARLYRAYGVPDSVVVEMVTTLPNAIHTLSAHEKTLLRTGARQ